MSQFQFLWQKFLVFLRIRPIIGGLEISDQVLRFAYYNGKTWRLHSVRLEPGALENGKIKDREKFSTALVALKSQAQLGGTSKGKKVSVVVSLSSVNIYSQVFSLPILAGASLEKAVELNLQMAAPGDAAKTYSGWEVVGKDEASGKLDILSAFIDREAVDELIQELFSAGFLTMAIEPRSVAFTRILREKSSGIDSKKPYLLLDIDNVGIDFLVIRNGLPYFEYSNPWKDVTNESGELSLENFQEELTASLRQVTNFYNQRWTEPIEGIIIAAATMPEVIEKTVASATTLPAIRLTLEMGQPISSEWLVAIGCSERGARSPRLGEGEMNLLGGVWEDRFQEEQIFRFVNFWRVLVPIVFAILVAMFWGTSVFLGTTKTMLESASQFNANATRTGEIGALEASSTAFNDLVSLAQAADNSTSKTYTLLDMLQSLASPDQIVINHLSYLGSGMTTTIDGSTQSDDRIVAFKMALENAPGVSNLDLPISGIEDNGGTYTFQVTFTYND